MKHRKLNAAKGQMIERCHDNSAVAANEKAAANHERCPDTMCAIRNKFHRKQDCKKRKSPEEAVARTLFSRPFNLVQKAPFKHSSALRAMNACLVVRVMEHARRKRKVHCKVRMAVMTTTSSSQS